MKIDFSGRVCRLAVAGAILFGSASCVYVNEELGDNFIPTDQKWDVYTPEAQLLTNIQMGLSDSLSAYNSMRFVFGSVCDDILGVCNKGTSFTLVPVLDTIDFGTGWEVLQFHFSAVRDTLSTTDDSQLSIIQNVYVSELKKPLDTKVLYTGAFMNMTETERNEYLDPTALITNGVPVYAGGDSLSFDFSKTFSERFIKQFERWQDEIEDEKRDTMSSYLEYLPGIYIETDSQTSNGGRINMFDVTLEQDSYGYVTGNYAELKIRSEYDGVKKDTAFLFIFGPSEFLEDGSSTIPTQYAFNSSDNNGSKEALKNWENGDRTSMYAEGGSGLKPLVKATDIKEIAERLITEANIVNIEEVVINKATIILPFDPALSGGYDALERFPLILSPTVRLVSTTDDTEDAIKYVTYAGLTDSSIESENQGDINRSLSIYSPDISHHVQEILKLADKSEEETDKEYQDRMAEYDIWMLIMHEETTTTSSSSSSDYSDYYNNLLYSSYYNNLYDPYGYGYGYGGYSSYGYGYSSNYYNYLMMAAYSSSYGSSSETTSTTVDKDRYYRGILNGPGQSELRMQPRIKITFSAPKTAEKAE